MWTIAYITGACIYAVLLIVLNALTNIGEDRGTFVATWSQLAVGAVAVLLWPIFVAITCVILLVFWWDMREWGKWQR